MTANRATLEELYGAAVTRDPRKLSWYQPVKLVYSMGYSLVMWLLVFGTLGFFQATFTAHTPVVRYIADSAYWIYLLHMPRVPYLQVAVGRWAFLGLPKFLLIIIKVGITRTTAARDPDSSEGSEVIRSGPQTRL